MVYAMPKWAHVPEINVQRRVRSRCWIRIEKIGNRQFNRVVGLAINGGSEKCREGSDRHIRDTVILAKCIKKGILEFS